jgi:hypothetical protein
LSEQIADAVYNRIAPLFKQTTNQVPTVSDGRKRRIKETGAAPPDPDSRAAKESPTKVPPLSRIQPAGFLILVGQILDGTAAMMQANQSKTPLYDVHLSITQSQLKTKGDPGPWKIRWQKEIDIGTCRALLTIGLPDRLPIYGEEHVRFDIFMLTRFRTYSEIITLEKVSVTKYEATMSFFETPSTSPSYTEVKVLTVVGSNLPPSGDATKSVKQSALLLANKMQPFYLEQAALGRAVHMISPPATKEDAETNSRNEQAFHDGVVSRFRGRFEPELIALISDMEKLGLDVSDIKQRDNAKDYWMLPIIINDLRALASQIDDHGNLVR